MGRKSNIIYCQYKHESMRGVSPYICMFHILHEYVRAPRSQSDSTSTVSSYEQATNHTSSHIRKSRRAFRRKSIVGCVINVTCKVRGVCAYRRRSVQHFRQPRDRNLPSGFWRQRLSSEHTRTHSSGGASLELYACVELEAEQYYFCVIRT